MSQISETEPRWWNARTAKSEHSNLRLTRTALIEEYPQAEYVYGRWDTVFGAWKRTCESGLVEFVPNFTFETAATLDQHVDGDFWYPDRKRPAKLSELLEDYRDLFSLGLLDLPQPEESPEAVDAYLDLIPQRFREATATLGRLSWLGLEACWYFEEFSDWLLRSRWHRRLATTIWSLAGARQKPRGQRRVLHERIYCERPLTLLSAFMPNMEARHCLSLIKRLRGRALDGRYLKGLLTLACSPQRIRALSHLPDLRVESLDALAGLPIWLTKPAAMAGVLSGGTLALEFVEYVRRNPKLLDEASRTWIAERMESVGNRSDVCELKERWKQRIAASTPFPSPPVILPPPFEPIDTFEKLKCEGRKMSNCSADYLGEILSGTSYFYHYHGDEPATVRLISSSACPWRCADIEGAGNAQLSGGTLAAIHRAVARTSGRDQ